MLGDRETKWQTGSHTFRYFKKYTRKKIRKYIEELYMLAIICSCNMRLSPLVLQSVVPAVAVK